MRRLHGAVIIIGVAALIVGALWGWQTWRRVDGRTANQWLAFTHQATQNVSYEASGQTTWHGTPASFTLAQADQGRYLMRVTDAKGQACLLGDDGESTWYQAKGKTIRTASASPTPVPTHARCRILGTATIAGRPSVTLRVQSGDVRKDLSIDRETGVTLAMMTANRQREVSRMTIERIAYQPVAVARCPMHAKATMQAMSRDESAALLGTRPVEAGWLPTGMTLRGVFRQWCTCCQQETAVLRYSDGVRSVTLFEMPGGYMCGLESGCRMAPTSGELIDSRRMGNITVVAVGNVDRKTLTKVIEHLR